MPCCVRLRVTVRVRVMQLSSVRDTYRGGVLSYVRPVKNCFVLRRNQSRWNLPRRDGGVFDSVMNCYFLFQARADEKEENKIEKKKTFKK